MVASFDLDTQLSQRIVAEYREMAGLRLTATQAARLLALDVDRCRTMLDVLVSEGSLARGANGQYCAIADHVWVRRRPATTRPRTPPRPHRSVAMRITVRATSSWLTRIAKRRFEFALGRFSSRVHSVTVRVADINGPRGGVDKRCRVTVQLQSPKRAIIVEDLDPDAAVAIDRVADRAARTVARLVDTATNWRTMNNGRQEVRG